MTTRAVTTSRARFMHHRQKLSIEVPLTVTKSAIKYQTGSPSKRANRFGFV
jgi:hypothetical protein